MNSFESANINIRGKSVEENLKAIKVCLDEMANNLNAENAQAEKSIEELRKSVSDLSTKVDESIGSLNARIARLEQR